MESQQTDQLRHNSHQDNDNTFEFEDCTRQ